MPGYLRAVPDFADDTTTEVERRITPLKVISLVEAGMWVLAAIFWVVGSRVAQLLLWSVHGTIAMAFAGMVLITYRAFGWSGRFAVLVVVTGPIGALVVFFRLRRDQSGIHAREQARLRTSTP